MTSGSRNATATSKNRQKPHSDPSLEQFRKELRRIKSLSPKDLAREIDGAVEKARRDEAAKFTVVR